MIIVYSFNQHAGAAVAAGLRASKPNLKARFVHADFFDPRELEANTHVAILVNDGLELDPRVKILEALAESYEHAVSFPMPAEVDGEIIADLVAKIREHAMAEYPAEPVQPELEPSETSEPTMHVAPAEVRKGRGRSAKVAEALGAN